MDWLDAIKWDAQGLVPAIAQEAGSGDVLMVAWMNREALAATRARGQAVYWSRSRGRLWHKGEESGHWQEVHALRLDCDGDVLLLSVTQHGHDPSVACHTGRHSCFFKRLDDAGRWQAVEPVLADPATVYAPAAAAGPALQPSSSPSALPSPLPMPTDTLTRLSEVIATRRAHGHPDSSYVARLFAKGPDAILKKIGEEATELVMAAKDGDASRIVAEAADLWFHVLVALQAHGIAPAAVLAELERREGLSGLEEFAARKSLQRDQEEGS